VIKSRRIKWTGDEVLLWKNETLTPTGEDKRRHFGDLKLDGRILFKLIIQK
jgi:hypothetical protein